MVRVLYPAPPPPAPPEKLVVATQIQPEPPPPPPKICMALSALFQLAGTVHDVLEVNKLDTLEPEPIVQLPIPEVNTVAPLVTVPIPDDDKAT